MQFLKKKQAKIIKADSNTSLPLENDVKDVTTGGNWQPRLNAKNGLRLAILLLMLVILFGVVQMVRSRNAYAVVDGQTISKQTFAQAKAANQNFAAKVSLVPPEIKDVTTYTRNQLILDAALQNEAAKAKVNVSKSEIDAKLFILALKDGKSAFGRDGYKKSLGWSDSDVDRYGRIKVLQDKLASRELKYLDILQAATYWSEIPGMTLAQAEAQAKQTLTDRGEPLFKDHKTVYEILAGNDAITGNGKPSTPTFINVNRLRLIDAQQIGEVQAAQITKLKKVGDYTPVSRGDAAFYFIDRLEGKGTGSYKSWEDLTAAASQRATIYKSGFDLRRLAAGLN